MAQPQDVAALIARSKVLVNPVLKKICKAEGRVQTGVKAQLQSRVIDIINTAAAAQDHDALQRLRYRLENNGEAPPPNGTITAPATFIPQYGSPTANGVPPVMPGAYGAHRSYGARTLPAPGGPPRIFKPSPFYDVLETIVGNIVLEASPQHRKTLPKTLQLSGPLGDRMRQDPSLKLMLFSSGEDSSLSAYQLHNIAFPQQFQVKINGDEVQANWKGLKNKPGSTRPADITDNVRKSPANYRNTMEITYALTQKKYTMHVYLVRKHGVGELAKRITERNVITKQAVLEELKRKANDPDIVVGSVNMGLKDPVSTMRISIPCRSTVCSHLQCFDAECFLQLQEQAPTWTCPICSKTVSYESLAVDQYVQEILKTVPKGTDHVTIEPDGKWSYGNADESRTPRRNGSAAGHNNDSDDEDLVEVTDQRVSAIKSEMLPTPSLFGTPSLSSREASSAPRANNKRKSEVIDLTLSDDDEPMRPAKKVAYHTPSSLPDPSRRYQAPAFGSASVPMRTQPQVHNMSSSMGLNRTPTSYQSMNGQTNGHSHDHPPAYGAYTPQPPPPPSHRNSYPGQGTAAYPTYLGSSP